MRILMEFTTINYRMWHSLAKRLQEIYPGSRFAVILGIAPGGEHILDFLTKQNDVKYEFIRLHHEIMKTAFESEIDFEGLKKFEEKLPQKSLWRVIAADRGIGSKFMHGVIWQKTFINQNASHENILRIFSGLLRQFRDIFEDFRPDLFLPAIAMGSIGVFIFEQICKEMNIPYIVPANVRVKNICAFSDDTQLRFPQIDETYKKLLEGRLSLDLLPAEKLYKELMSELENPAYFDLKNDRMKRVEISGILDKIKLLLLYIPYSVGRELLNWIMLEKFKDIRSQPNNLATLLDNISFAVQFRLQQLRVTDPAFGTKLDSAQKYLYYPLHTNPEYSTQVQGTMWLDQIHLIELLAKSVPSDWVVYVKEHPATIKHRLRPWSFYRRIERIPNVVLAPVYMDMHNIIDNAEMIAVITGTTGWEAILRNKPVITFADHLIDVLNLSRKCTDIEKLSVDIHDEIRRIEKVSKAERERRIVCFLAAILKHGFWMDYPKQLFYIESGTDNEYEIAGRQVADALETHLAYIREKKSTKLYSTTA